MDSNTNNTAPSVPPSSATGSVPSPTDAAASPTQNAPMTQQHKGKPMVWVILLLLFILVCGLAIALWYFQTQSHMF